MAAETLATAINAGDTNILFHWLSGQDQDEQETDAIRCTRSEFVTYFLCYLRSQTESILQTNANALQILQHQSTPEKLLSQRKSQTVEATETPPTNDENNLSVKTDRRRHESPSNDKSKKPGRRVKTKLFENENESFGYEVASSTPMKNSDFPQLPFTSPVTPNVDLSTSRNSSKYSYSDSSKERCDTPRMSHSRHSSKLSSAEKSINLGDYITNATKVGSKKKKSFKNISNDFPESREKEKLDLSSSHMFPEIGAKKTSRSGERRRIKPTNIDSSTSSGSSSFASFNSETFQPPSLAFEENVAFKQQKFQPKELANSFNTERSILKQERHQLMEKFNILNTSTKICPVTPQIKVLKSEFVEKVQTYVEGDLSKVTFKDKLETIAEIYNVLLKNSLIHSISAEIYFMISILLSKQCSEDYETVESNLKSDNNVCDFLLKSVHNCSYVAVRTLWSQRNVLEVMLDKFSLKLLGEHKRVRSFYPDLAKHLLNLYSLKCEGDAYSGREESTVVLENRFPNGVVCFNSETDNVDNFPSVLSFQNFKKQRDLFYEILRWWSDTANQSIGSSRAQLKSRVKSLLALAITPANHSHLARLFITHLLSECISTSQESKMSKLQRRLTGPAPTPASAESNRLPRFSGREEFYRLFLTVTESEGFRAHVRDGLACELCALDAACLPGGDERHDCVSYEMRQEYLHCVRRLRLLAKFLGLVVAAPYQPASEYADMASPGVARFVPKEKVLLSERARRHHIQPPIDLQTILETSVKNHRLTITLPWLILYLAMMDYIGLRVQYSAKLLATLFQIYANLPEDCINKSTVVFLKLCLGWLFELPHFPQEEFYEPHLESRSTVAKNKSEWSIDSLDVVDETVLAEVCPHLKEFNVLLLSSHPSNELKDVGSTFRHITPVTMSLNTADRAKNKERELQARLEEELLRGQASSTRRVLELVADRVTSATVKELMGALLGAARVRCREEALRLVQAWRGNDTSGLHKQLEQMYSAQFARMRSSASESARASVAARVRMALRALLASATSTAPLETVAQRQCLARVNKWLAENWGNVGVLCKDITAEISHLQMLGVSFLPHAETEAAPAKLITSPRLFDRTNISAAELIIHVKELICQLLEYSSEQAEAPPLLERARVCCKTDNLFITPTSRKAILQLSVELLVVLVSRKPQLMTDPLLNKFDALWNECCPNRPRNGKTDDSVQNKEFPFDPRDFAPADERMATPVSSDEEDTAKQVKIVIETSKITNKDVSSTEKNLSQPKIDSIAMKSISEIVLKGETNLSKNSQSETNLSKSPTNFPKSDLKVSKSELNVSKSEKTASKSERKASKLETNVSKSDMNVSKTEKNASKSERKAPKLETNVSKSDMNVSKSEKIVSKSRMNASKSETNMLKLPSDSLKCDLNSSKAENTENESDLLDLFNRILCPRNIVILSETRSVGEEVWSVMSRVLVFLLKNDYLSEDSLTEQCLAVYRQDWSQDVLERLSVCMRSVSSARGRAAGNFALFLDFLAEFCGDMEDLPPATHEYP